MTREEAIKGLKRLRDDFSGYKPNEEMFDMAIKALENPEQNVIAVVPCGDAISRQAAVYVASGFCSPSNVADELAKLPSVQPIRPRGHWILDETDNSITCDKCGCLIWANDISNGDAYYCPNCGAKMVEPQESEEQE